MAYLASTNNSFVTYLDITSNFMAIKEKMNFEFDAVHLQSNSTVILAKIMKNHLINVATKLIGMVLFIHFFKVFFQTLDDNFQV